MNELINQPMNEPVNFFRPILQLLIENLALASDRTPRCRRPGKMNCLHLLVLYLKLKCYFTIF